MDKLFLAINTMIADNVTQEVLPELLFKWEKDNDVIVPSKVPVVLFRVNKVKFKDSHKRYSMGKMEISIKIIFKSQSDNEQTSSGFLDGFQLVKDIETLIRSVESEETDRLRTVWLKEKRMAGASYCFQYLFKTSYFPTRGGLSLQKGNR